MKQLVLSLVLIPLMTSSDGEPGSPIASSQARDQIFQVEREFEEAISKGAGPEFFERLLAEEAVITESNGRTHSKEEFLKAARKGDRRPVPIEQTDLKVQVYGESAVVTGLMNMAGVRAPGDRFTHVFVKRAGRWQMVAAQWTSKR